MKTAAIHPQPITAVQVLFALGHCLTLCALYALQHTAQAFGAAERLTLRACDWLAARHNFADQDSPVYLSGWQYLGTGALVIACALLLAIRW